MLTDSLERFPSQNSSPQELSCQYINFIQFVWCRSGTQTIPSLQSASTSETSVYITVSEQRIGSWASKLAYVAKQQLTQAVQQLTTILAKRSCSYYISSRFLRRKRGNFLVFILKQNSQFSVCCFLLWFFFFFNKKICNSEFMMTISQCPDRFALKIHFVD